MNFTIATAYRQIYVADSVVEPAAPEDWTDAEIDARHKTNRYIAALRPVGDISAWSKSSRFRLLLVVMGVWPAALYLVMRIVTAGSIRPGDLVLALVPALLFGLLVPLLLIVSTKTGERTLSIDRKGIKTTIGKMRGEIPWSKVGSIEVTDSQVLIVGSTPNIFAIPSRAFDNMDERDRFYETAKDYQAAARVRTAV